MIFGFGHGRKSSCFSHVFLFYSWLITNERGDCMDKEMKPISWLDLSEEEIIRLSDVSVCMYNGQEGDERQ